MNKSIWETSLTKFERLEEDKVCDVCIVGGGITGISLAYYLKDTSLKTVLIEQDQLASSTTMRSTAKLTYLQKDMLTKIQKYRGKSWAKKYYQAQKDAISEIVSIIKKEKISCHLEKSPSYLFVQEDKNISKLKKEFLLYKEFGAPIKWSKKLPMDFGEKACCFVEDTYVFHPLEYVEGLISAIEKTKSVEIYENTRMHNFLKKDGVYEVHVKDGPTIHAKQMVFAGHYPPFIFPYCIPLKTYLEKDFVESFQQEHFSFNAINLDKEILSIRFFEDHIIQVIDSKTLSNSAIEKSPFSNNPQFYWVNYDIMMPDYLPVVGFIGSKASGLFIGTGFNTWGMTNSNLAAQILASCILRKEHLYASLFSPKRPLTLLSFFHMIWNALLNTYHFIASYFPNQKNAQILWKNGKRLGVVIDDKKKRHVVKLTCPHMKCGLRYNPHDKTWDCPCHGSRFDVDGNLLRGPSTDCVQPDTTS